MGFIMDRLHLSRIFNQLSVASSLTFVLNCWYLFMGVYSAALGGIVVNEICCGISKNYYI